MSAPITTSMASPSGRRRSNLRLVLLLAAIILPPVVLALGPFRKQFFPAQTHAIQAVAIVVAPDLDFAALVDARWSREEVAELRRLFDSKQYAALEERLGREPRLRMTPGLKYLHGMAALLDRRPAIALKGLEDARQEGDAKLRAEASFALAQALLLTGNRDAARAALEPIAATAGPHREEAARQLDLLSALR
jgi:hypothetical protein